MQNTPLLTGRVAIIIGASSGIGAASARSLALAGAHVVLVARRKERLESLAQEIQQKGGEATTFVADITQDNDVGSLFADIKARFRKLDILVNSAGIMLLSPVAEASPQDWRRMIDSNLYGLMLTCQMALPLMKASGAGHIVNIASLAGRVANPNASGYAATKFGVVAFSESLRREVFADKIRVTVIEPGVVESELQEHITNAAMKANLLERMAQVESLQPEDIAAAILYAVTQPPRVAVNEILIRPAGQER
ncbi:MAG: SDR family NAD(P)-dependent oxidoreductase [Anaerolineaceae bacterium]|nr:SDR family NAD(P)-dependent oxidoreductase [Anaerolineaceae bacterium]